MKGGLRKPVKVTVLDGSSVIWERVLLGRRSDDSPKAKAVVLDTDDTFTVQWAQCANVRAPRPVVTDTQRAGGSGYECGEAEVYLRQELHVKKGAPASRVVKFAAPPEPACWADSLPPQAEADAAAAPPPGDAAAEATAEPSSDAAVGGEAATEQAAPTATAAPSGQNAATHAEKSAPRR